ncbi:MAG TPA: hypothetical protein VGK57_02950 [Candidatus Binatia bacterium]
MNSVMSHPLERQVAVSATKLLINNRWIANESGKTFATIAPATGAEICQVSEGGQRSNKDRGGRHRHQSEDVCSTVLPTLYTEVKTVTSKL